MLWRALGTGHWHHLLMTKDSSIIFFAFLGESRRKQVYRNMGTRVYVGRLPYKASERDVEHFFRGYGRIVEVIMKNGYAFVEFQDYRDADDAAHDLNGRDLLGERQAPSFF